MCDRINTVLPGQVDGRLPQRLRQLGTLLLCAAEPELAHLCGLAKITHLAAPPFSFIYRCYRPVLPDATATRVIADFRLGIERVLIYGRSQDFAGHAFSFCANAEFPASIEYVDVTGCELIQHHVPARVSEGG